jgi:hypothetical protein
MSDTLEETERLLMAYKNSPSIESLQRVLKALQQLVTSDIMKLAEKPIMKGGTNATSIEKNIKAAIDPHSSEQSKKDATQALSDTATDPRKKVSIFAAGTVAGEILSIAEKFMHKDINQPQQNQTRTSSSPFNENPTPFRGR